MLARTLAVSWRSPAAVRWCSAVPVSAQPLERVCVVGTGPAGFYTAKYLLKQSPDVRVDLVDLLPTPFGLVRSGVAPDHPEVKSVQNDFAEVAQSDRLDFRGNVAVGVDVSVADLQKHYNAVVLAYGAASDKWLDVPGEDLGNVMSARAFVNWYNAHPEYVHLQPNLACEDVVVVGQGNVAVDCARILAKTVEELASTDIASHALEALSRSQVKRVHVVGRRGHVQAAFTMKELRELTRLNDAALLVDPRELAAGMTPASVEEIGSHRAKKRMNQLLIKVADEGPGAAKSRSVALQFLRSPTRFVPAGDDADVVGGVEVEVNTLTGAADAQSAQGTGRLETIPAGLVLKSIGYKSLAVDGVPFDASRHVVRNHRGQVVTEEGDAVPGLFCVGWLKRGPSGIIGTNIQDAKETVAAVLTAQRSGSLPAVARPGGLQAVTDLVVASGKPRHAVVDWAGYQAIDAEEVRLGEAAGKPREKLTTVDDMLAAAQTT